LILGLLVDLALLDSVPGFSKSLCNFFSMTERALGLLETRGLVAALEAADAMLKAANVVFVGKEVTDAALVTIKVVGEVAAVKAAIEAGRAAAQSVGEVVSTHIIPRPDNETELVGFTVSERQKINSTVPLQTSHPTKSKPSAKKPKA
jgi:microcompartment protein CcmL/EutN